MNNRNNPDSEQDEQERLEQEQREQRQRAAALRNELRQAPDGGDEGKDPIIINKSI